MADTNLLAGLTGGPFGARLLERFQQLRPQSLEAAAKDPRFKEQLHRAEDYYIARKAKYANDYDRMRPPSDSILSKISRVNNRVQYIEECIDQEIDHWVRNFPRTGYAE